MNSTAKSVREFRTWVILLSVLPLCANQLAPWVSVAVSALIMWFIYAAIAWVLGSRIVGLTLLGSVVAPFLFAGPVKSGNAEYVLLQSLLMMAAGAVSGSLLGWILEPGDTGNVDAARAAEPAQEEREPVPTYVMFSPG